MKRELFKRAKISIQSSVSFRQDDDGYSLFEDFFCLFHATYRGMNILPVDRDVSQATDCPPV